MNRTFELVKLLTVCESIDGRKKLQKIVHVLRSLGFSFTYQYSFHHHGAFSAELKNEIDLLVAGGLVEESEQFAGEYRKYVYKATSEAHAVLKTSGIGQISPPWINLAKELSRMSAQDLEAISTVFYLDDLGYSDSALREQFTRLKPHLVANLDSSISQVGAMKAGVARK